MLKTAQMLLIASTALVLLAFVGYVSAMILMKTARRVGATAATARDAQTVGEAVEGSAPGTTPSTAVTVADPRPEPAESKRGVLWMSSRLTQLSFVLLTVSLVLRTIATGHPPFANHYEFAVSFAWGMIGAHIYFEWKYKVRTLALVILPVIGAILVYATTLSYAANPLVPALQNSPLLTMHVFCAAVAYGAAVVSFGAAVMYLLSNKITWSGWPKKEILDEISYKAVVVTFPMLTIMIILGSIWANVAWGSYWSWDPKETAALMTWLIYGAYLHARVVRDWRGTKSTWLLVLGFLAILFTYFGNLFFGGLHSYV